MTSNMARLLLIFFVYTSAVSILCVSILRRQRRLWSKANVLSKMPARFWSAAFSLINLSGLPPFLGAYLKFCQTRVLLEIYSLRVMIFFLLSSVWWLYLYLQIIYLWYRGEGSVATNGAKMLNNWRFVLFALALTPLALML
jgi:formate hydrogenlyase subunit 3/multisubunit Na+/H+ antiporter MnhD subunit